MTGMIRTRFAVTVFLDIYASACRVKRAREVLEHCLGRGRLKMARRKAQTRGGPFHGLIARSALAFALNCLVMQSRTVSSCETNSWLFSFLFCARYRLKRGGLRV
jgi:hypothetical protein